MPSRHHGVPPEWPTLLGQEIFIYHHVDLQYLPLYDHQALYGLLDVHVVKSGFVLNYGEVVVQVIEIGQNVCTATSGAAACIF